MQEMNYKWLLFLGFLILILTILGKRIFENTIELLARINPIWRRSNKLQNYPTYKLSADLFFHPFVFIALALLAYTLLRNSIYQYFGILMPDL